MIDVIQFVKLRPEVQKELEARYRVHWKDNFDEGGRHRARPPSPTAIPARRRT